MSALSLVFSGAAAIFEDPLTILYFLIGVFGGIVFGAIPGLTGAPWRFADAAIYLRNVPYAGHYCFNWYLCGRRIRRLDRLHYAEYPRKCRCHRHMLRWLTHGKKRTSLQGVELRRNGQPDRRPVQRCSHDFCGHKAGSLRSDVWSVGIFRAGHYGPCGGHLLVQR